MSWSAEVHHFIVTAGSIGDHIAAGLKALTDSSVLATLTRELPNLQPMVTELTNLIPDIGTAKMVLNIADWTAQHWAAIAVIGAAVNFAPADVLTFKQWEDPTDPAARQE